MLGGNPVVGQHPTRGEGVEIHILLAAVRMSLKSGWVLAR